MEKEQAQNAEIGKKLRDQFNSGLPKSEKRNVRFPSSTSLRVKESTDGHFEIFMTTDAISANMQENKAAFEAWALILRVHLNATKVSLIWDKGVSDVHTKRFELRARVFEKVFSGWFSAQETEPFPRDGSKLVLNLPSDHEARAQAREEVITDPKSEADYEKVLVQSEDLKRFIGLEKLDRQLPVGVFANAVKGSTRHFSGGKSAVDLVGLDASSNLHLFELKRPDNNTVGAFSELLFYASVFSCTHDTARTRIEYNGVVADHCVNPSQIKAADKIYAHILSFDLHPLLNCAKIFDLINSAVANGLLSSQPVRFGYIRIENADGALSFHHGFAQ
jgi:hypothetical protein